MHYKFVDIGCGHQSVSSDVFGTDVVGMYVEPIWEYLNVLPSGSRIKKCNCVVSDVDGFIDFNAVIIENPVYYSNSQMAKIVTNKTLRNDYLRYFRQSGQSSIKIAASKSKKIRVQSVKLSTLFDTYDVESIEHLKIDVEGHEEVILVQLLDLIKESKVEITKEIKFEYNKLSDLVELNRVVAEFESLGYRKRYETSLPWNEDVVLSK